MGKTVFFAPTHSHLVADIAHQFKLELVTPQYGDCVVSRLAAAPGDGRDCLIFIASGKHVPASGLLNAAAVIVSRALAPRLAECGAAVLIAAAPQRSFSAIGRSFYPAAVRPTAILGKHPGLSADATIDVGALLEDGVTVEAGARIGVGVEIGSGTIIAANCVVGAGCKIGRACSIGANTTLRAALIGDDVIIHDGARIGNDGFGFVAGPSGLEKVPQIGRVIIQNGVEIGANTTIDRGALGDTVVGEGSKIDNLVQIAHNVVIGRHSVIAGMTGIAGSCVVGDGVMIGAGCGISDHVTINSGAVIAGASNVIDSVPAGAIWGGSPAKPFQEAAREVLALKKLAARKPRESNDG
jgi:UDP-3-O-[3-hydroxymyristoyl] glucosamine N-acyltransferase